MVSALRAVLLFALAAAVVHAQVFDPAETCEATDYTPAGCWQQLESRPGCYVLNVGFGRNETVSWTGACRDSVADGGGVLIRTVGSARGHRYEAVVYENAWMEQGALHGGPVIVHYTDSDTTAIGNYANGLETGLWIVREAEGTVQETPYVDGKRHGTEVKRFGDGGGYDHFGDPDPNVRELETSYVDGWRRAEIRRYADGSVEETPLDGEDRHGTQVHRYADGRVRETPWVYDRKHGSEVHRDADGNVIEEILYIEGEKQPDA